MFKQSISTLFLLLTLNFVSGQTILKLKKENGIYLIPCKINGVLFDFFFDTGASFVSISLKEAKELAKLGKLTSQDIIGKTQMRIASGQFVSGTIIILRELKIGDLILKNIEAIITESQNAPLLLGQSAIKNFGEFTFNYSTETLKINKFSNNTNSITIFQMYDEHKKGLTPSQLLSYDKFYKHKSEIVENIYVELAKYKVYQVGGDTHVSFSFDITNNSEYDFSINKQTMAKPIKFVNIVVTLFTEDGKSYTAKEKLTDILSHNTISTSDSFIDINIRNNKVKGVKYRVVDLDF